MVLLDSLTFLAGQTFTSLCILPIPFCWKTVCDSIHRFFSWWFYLTFFFLCSGDVVLLPIEKKTDNSMYSVSKVFSPWLYLRNKMIIIFQHVVVSLLKYFVDATITLMVKLILWNRLIIWLWSQLQEWARTALRTVTRVHKHYVSSAVSDIQKRVNIFKGSRGKFILVALVWERTKRGWEIP